MCSSGPSLSSAASSGVEGRFEGSAGCGMEAPRQRRPLRHAPTRMLTLENDLVPCQEGPGKLSYVNRAGA